MPTFGQDDEVVAAPFGADDEVVQTFGQDDEEVPGAMGGAVSAVRRGVKSAQMIAPTLLAAGAGQTKPTFRQGRRAFEAAMADPDYQARVIEAQDNPEQLAKVESLFGPAQRLEQMTAPQRAVRDVWSGVVAEMAQEREAIPRSQAQHEIAQAPDQATKWQVFRKYPGQVTSSIILESLPPALAGIFIGGAAGPGGAVAGVAASSTAMEFSNEFLSEAARQGYNPEDADSFAKFLDDRKAYGRALGKATARAGYIGALDAASMGMAGTFLGPVLKDGLKKVVAASAAEVATQAAAGATGEALGQLATREPGEPLDWFDIAMEGVAEVATGPVEAASNLRRAGRSGAVRGPESDPDVETGLRELDQALAEMQAPSPGGEGRGEDGPAVPNAAAPVQTPGQDVSFLPTFEPERLTPEQQMARESLDAMADLRARKAAARATSSSPAAVVAPDGPAATVPVVAGAETAPPAVAGEPASAAESRMIPSGGRGVLEEGIKDSNGNGDLVNRYYGSKGVGGYVEWDWSAERAPDAPHFPRIRWSRGGATGTGKTLYLEALREAKAQGVSGLASDPFGVDEGGDRFGPTAEAIGVQDSLARRGLITISKESDGGRMLEITPKGEAFLAEIGSQNATAAPKSGGAGIKTPSETQSRGLRYLAASSPPERKLGPAYAGGPHGQAGKGNVSALQKEDASALTGTKKANPPGAVKRRPTLGSRADGVPDLLDVIQELGGIKPPGSQKGTAEYEGYAAAFNQGPAAMLRGGSERPDIILQPLAERGYRFETPDEFYAAVERASAERDAVTRQVKAERTLRPEMIERVQTLHDAALAGQPVSSEQFGELESRLNDRERKAMKAPLVKLRTLVDVAPAADELSDIEAAKVDVREAWAAFTPSTNLFVGIPSDPVGDARKTFALYKALVKLATAYARNGVKTAAEFAQRIGMELNAVVQAAWDDAVAGKAKTNPLQLEPAAVAEVVDGMRERKFSRRFDADERMAPELRAQTGNRTYIPIGNELTVTQASGIIEEQGIDAGIAMLKDERNRNLSDRERVALGQAIVTKLNHEYAQTKNEATLDKAVDVAEWLTEYGTRLGQGVQAFAIWSRLTPDGFVRAYVRAVNDSNPGHAGIADAETKKRIHKKASDALAKPEGFQRDEALVDVLADVARSKGVSKMDIAVALWYANLLSGWPSWLRNAAGNIGFLMAESAAHAAVRPQAVPSIVAGLFRGFANGVPQAVAVLKSGKQTGARVGKVLEAPRVLELKKFSGIAYPLNAWKYVFRIMSAIDMVAFESAQEMHSRFLAREAVRTGRSDGRTYSQLLANSRAQRSAAANQAESEGLSGVNYRRRIAEIIRQQRPDALNTLAAQYGLYATFNQPPRGALGAVARHLSELSQQFAPLRTVTPFTHIVANVLNNTLDYTPWGYRRLFPSTFLKDRAGRTLNYLPEDSAPVDYQLQAARATLGTVGLTALWALSQSFGDDDDPVFDISGNGPSSPTAREGLKETGWRPYSVKLGNRWVSYQQAPIAPGLAWLGFLRDAQRTKKWINMDDWSRFAYAGKALGPAMLSQNFVSGLRDFLQDLSDDYVDPNGPKFRWASRTAGSVIPAAVKAVDKAFDPTIYDSVRFPQALLREIPYARSEYLKPALNALGEPVRPPGIFSSVANPDPLWAVLAAKQALPGKPSRSMMVGDRPITPEEHYELVRVRGRWLGERLRRPEVITILATRPAEQVQRYVEDYSEAATRSARSQLKLRPPPPRR